MAPRLSALRAQLFVILKWNNSLHNHSTNTDNMTSINFKHRVFSPVESRRPILQSKEQVKKIRENSLATRIIQNKYLSKPSSPTNNKIILRSSNPPSIRKRTNRRNFHNTSNPRSNGSTNSSPNNTVFSQERLNRFLSNIQRK